MNDESGMVSENPSEAPSGIPKFLVRLLSAAVLAPISLLAIYYGGLATYFFVTTIMVLMVLEWNRLVYTSVPDRNYHLVAGIGMVSMPIILWFGLQAEWLFAGLSILACAVALLILTPREKNLPLWAVFGLGYISFAGLSFLWLRIYAEDGLLLVVWIFFFVWATDIGGYAFGKTIGGPKLAPVISPKKTWAGFFGGLLLATLVGLAMGLFVEQFDLVTILVLSLLFSVVSQMGDLFESSIKRHFKVKDIDGFIPGHGGFLDRVDGLVFVLYAAALWSFVHGGQVMTLGLLG